MNIISTDAKHSHKDMYISCYENCTFTKQVIVVVVVLLLLIIINNNSNNSKKKN